jgi:hypothetical protein
VKLGKTFINNTDRHLLDMLGVADLITAETIARLTYPQSKQIEKKTATYTKRLRRLQRFGYVKEVQGAWLRTHGVHVARTRPAA